MLHFVPNGIKLRGHIGSELQRKAAGILSIEEDKEKRKTDELIAVVKEAFRNSFKLTYQELCEVLMREMEIKDRTAKKYIAYMKEQRILSQDTNGNYQKGELCRT